MNIFQKVGNWFMNVFRTNAEKEFDVKVASSSIMEVAQAEWSNIIQGRPYWMDEDIRTINFAKHICSFVSAKTCMDIAVSIDGSDRADYISKCIDNMLKKSLRDEVEDACALGGIILKPNGTFNPAGAIDYVMPGSFFVTEKNSNGDILGCIFVDRLVKGDDYYTRLEYHHFVKSTDTAEYAGRNYSIENKAYKSKGSNALGKQIPLTNVPEWENIEPVLILSNIEKPLFGYFKMPFNNTIDYFSPEGVSIFSNAIEELRDIDIAWTRKANEAEDSQHLTFINDAALTKRGPDGKREARTKLPRFVRGLQMGVDASSTIEEHVPTMLTEQRISDINNILSMISTKCGLSQGTFTFDAKSGLKTATEVESDMSETVDTISDIRTALESAISDLIYAINKYCDVFFDMPDGYVNALDPEVSEEDIFYFKDLLASFEQDRNRAYQLMLQGKYSTRKYLKEYEGFSDDEIDAMMEEIAEENKAKQSSGLFSEE